MRHIWAVVLGSIMLSLVAFGTIRIAQGQPVSQDGGFVLAQETQGANLREITAPNASSLGNSPQQPTIGFIDSPSATCYQPDAARDACYINWYYLAVDANPNYMITMTVSLNAIGPVAHVQGFFQTSMYIPYNMLGQGIQVACGAPGEGGDPNLGAAYSYIIRARDSSNLGSANYGTVYCPAFAP